jgi:hypothetical protein
LAALAFRKTGYPEIRAWMVFSIAQGINLYIFEQLYFTISHTINKTLPDYIVILTALVVLIINYFLFLYKDRFKFVIEKYREESKTSKITGAIVGYLYVFITVVFVFYAKHLQFS